jgi:diguanylate cyclase (GGDEF)-like protein
MKALVVEDVDLVRKALCAQLAHRGWATVEAGTGAAALGLNEIERPDLILLDVLLPDLDGHEVARQIRAREQPEDWTPIIFLTALDGDEDVSKAVAAGGDDYLVKPVSPVVLEAKIRAQQRNAQGRRALLHRVCELDAMNQALRHLTWADELTGIPNRRYFDDVVVREWRRARRTAEPLALIIADIDHFKNFNDRYGHPAGDQYLRAVAHALRDQLRRPGDAVARYGGEEFVAVLAATDDEGACRVAERMREAVAAGGSLAAMSHAAASITISAGVASCVPGRDDGAGPEELVRRADVALYAAKRQGRNRVAVYDKLDTAFA